MKKLALLLFTGLYLLSSCTSQAAEPAPILTSTQTQAPAAQPETPTPTSAPTTCPEAAYTPPAMPEVVPGYLHLDEATGLHMTGNVQEIDPQDYRLKISGLVDTPLELRYEELRCMPKISDDPLLVCEGFFTDQATWAGVPLSYILNLAGVQTGAGEITLVSADGYQISIGINEAMNERSFLAYELNGEVLPVLHGFPLRAVFPGKNGNFWTKWLVEIQVH